MMERAEVFDEDYDLKEVRAFVRTFSVCMTIKDEVDNVEDVLNDLLCQTVLADQIVIMDNGSKDGTYEKLLKWAALWPIISLGKTEGISISASRNATVAAAAHDVLMFVDAGNHLPNNLFANLLGPLFMEDSVPDIVAGICQAKEPCRWSRYFIPETYSDDYLQNEFLPSTKCMATTKDLVNKVGGFADWLQRCGQDTAFSMAARRVSSRWIINRKACILWGAPTTEDAAVKLAYRYALGNGELGFDINFDPVIEATYLGYQVDAMLKRVKDKQNGKR